jgi:predicted phage terminase large subunit-like protein
MMTPESPVDIKYRPPIRRMPTIASDRYIVPASERELIARAQAHQELITRRARDDFNLFMEYCFADPRTGYPFAQQWFHEEWAAAMANNARQMIVAPRDHGKTTQIVGQAIWQLGRDPNLRIKIACAADGRAKERLFEISQNITGNPRIAEVFPNLRPEIGSEWSKHKIIVKRSARHRDASVEALGITATATGGRCDLLIADDVVDRRNSLSFPALRTQIKQAWKSDWTNLLEPESRVWYICTLWHKDDLSHEILVNGEYQKLFYAVDQQFGALWPGKWASKDLQTRFAEIGSVEFNRGFRNQVVDDDSAMVNPAWIQYADLEKDAEFMERFGEMSFITSYDTAGSPTGNAEQDFSSSCTIAIDAVRRKIYIVDAWRGRLTLKGMAEQVIKEYTKYRPVRILIEKVGQASLDEWVLNIAPELAGIVQVTKPRVSKAQRLLAVTPLMERGEVVFSSYLDPDGHLWNVARGSLAHELLDFPFGKHDDMVDAFSQALAGARDYFLDAWATGAEDVIDIRVGPATGEAGYLI